MNIKKFLQIAQSLNNRNPYTGNIREITTKIKFSDLKLKDFDIKLVSAFSAALLAILLLICVSDTESKPKMIAFFLVIDVIPLVFLVLDFARDQKQKKIRKRIIKKESRKLKKTFNTFVKKEFPKIDLKNERKLIAKVAKRTQDYLKECENLTDDQIKRLFLEILKEEKEKCDQIKERYNLKTT